MDKLLAGWEQEGIATSEAARARHAQVAGAARASEASKQAAPANFQQRSYTREESQSVYFDLAKYYAKEDEGK